jgi:hypothetical protein
MGWQPERERCGGRSSRRTAKQKKKSAASVRLERNTTMTTEQTEQHGDLRASLLAVAAVGLLLVVTLPSFIGADSRLSLLFGALLAVANLWLLARTVRGFLNPAGGRSPWLVIALLKLGALFLLVAFLVRGGYAHVLPLMIGYGALPIGIVVSQLRSSNVARGEG